ncbi:hypothetical protein [Ottowia sp.]|uniref:hypothetical protein n=1 Tax=Ottowia sp. TaxID=1898956 RepID=UPI003A842C12
MSDTDTQDLAGRIDALGQAMLRLCAGLEMKGVIDGPRMCAAWRARRVPAGTDPALEEACLRTLGQMADELDAAREVRRSRARP